MLIHVQTKTHKITYREINFHFFTKLYPLQCKLPTKKQSNIHTNNKLPQTHKIEAQKTKNLQELIDLQKLVHKPPNLPHQIEK
jgi:hypothetical protein